MFEQLAERHPLFGVGVQQSLNDISTVGVSWNVSECLITNQTLIVEGCIRRHEELPALQHLVKTETDIPSIHHTLLTVLIQELRTKSVTDDGPVNPPHG